MRNGPTLVFMPGQFAHNVSVRLFAHCFASCLWAALLVGVCGGLSSARLVHFRKIQSAYILRIRMAFLM